jgi:hypothetical protein
MSSMWSTSILTLVESTENTTDFPIDDHCNKKVNRESSSSVTGNVTVADGLAFDYSTG